MIILLKTKHLFIWATLILVAGCSKGPRPADYVDPMIGTDGPGHTFPGPSMPFGMVQLGPDTRISGWEGCAGYHYSDDFIYGFSHTHLSGTGVSDYGDVLVFPFTGTPMINRGSAEDPESGYGSKFDHDNEHAEAGYYRVKLDKGKVLCQLTATERVGFHSYTFRKRDQPGIIIDLTHRDQVLSSSLGRTGANEISGYRRSKAWAQDQHIYFVMQFSQPIRDYKVFKDKELAPGSEANGKDIRSWVTFASSGKKNPLLVKVGISAVSIEGARKNLEAEVPDWNFKKVRSQAWNTWNETLSAIMVSGGAESDKRNFYTSFYHLCLAPNLFMDVDGKYRGRDLLIHQATDHTHYTVFSLWDTFRAVHPMFTLLEPARTTDFVKTFLRQYEEGGMLPVWELAGNETGTMIGYHSIPVIVDAWVKGIRDFDGNLAFQAMKNSAQMDHLGLKHYKSIGYIPANEEPAAVSKTLEYAYDDWCIAQMALALQQDSDYVRFIKRAQHYKNVFDPSTGFMRAKMGAQWYTPFDPKEVNFNYTEANAWQYSFFVPHDVSGLMNLLGGKDSLAAKLDQLFAEDSEFTGIRQADITGMIGQYAHGNEPSHHIAYLYNFVGQPWKTQQLVRQILDDQYRDEPDGLCGNEDCGQMSAWYMFSALGFYPVSPGQTHYIIGSPLFDQAIINLPNGKTFIINAGMQSQKNRYIREAFLNGVPLNRSWIDHAEIINGGTLEFNMSSEPNEDWGRGEGNEPITAIDDHQILISPFIDQGDVTFRDFTEVSLGTIDPGDQIHYQIAPVNSVAMNDSRLYSGPLKFNQTQKVWFFSTNGRDTTPVYTGDFFKNNTDYRITAITAYAPHYAAGGDQALLDGLRGARNYHAGAWQGFEENDLVALVDLGSSRSIHRLTLSCLQEQQLWIFLPLSITFETSADQENWTSFGVVTSDLSQSAVGTYIVPFVSESYQQARYIRVTAKNQGICPDWHHGAGGKAWIFADELIIE